MADLRHDTIMANALSLPDVRESDVRPAVEAALRHETAEIPAELLVSIMWGESRFIPTIRTGIVCGIMQVGPHNINRPRKVCSTWDRDVDMAVADGVRELKMLLSDKRVRGNVRRALLYRACGNAAFNGSCKKGAWPGWVLQRARRLIAARS